MRPEFAGEWILKEAYGIETQWIKKGITISPFSLFINLSPKQLRFMYGLTQIIENIGSGLSKVNFDLSHGLFNERYSEISDLLYKNKVNYSLDDSGTYGEIDVLWVKQKGFNTIKIDDGLINQALKNEQSKKYLFDLIASAKSLGINTLAEGVENQRQLSLARACNFDFAQGYYFSRPLLANEFSLLLTAFKSYGGIIIPKAN